MVGSQRQEAEGKVLSEEGVDELPLPSWCSEGLGVLGRCI